MKFWLTEAVYMLLIFGSGHGRRKRSHYWSDWKGCSSSEAKIMNDCLARYQPSQIKLLCKYQTTTCYYYARCAHRSGFSFDYYCNLIVHRYNYQGICCTPSCWSWVTGCSCCCPIFWFKGVIYYSAYLLI